MSTEDALSALVVDESDVARDELAGALAPFVRFTRGGELLFEPSFSQLPAVRKVCCVLLAARAAHLLGLRKEPRLTPKDLVSESGLPAGTVRPKLAELLRLRLAVSDSGSYGIPTHSLRRAAAFTTGDMS